MINMMNMNFQPIMSIIKITLNHSSRQLPILHPLEFKAFGAEVDQKADFQVVRLQVVDGLGEMDGLQLDDGFEFDGHHVLDQEVGPSLADLFVFVEDRHFVFSLEGDMAQVELVGQGALVDDFLEAVAQFAVDFHGAVDDVAGEGGVFVFVVDHGGVVF